MEIRKELNLNKTPKDVVSGSLIGAKNMVIDDTGSFFTNERGFIVGFECPNDTEFIAGCIPCNSELVIFTYQRNNGVSRIYRKRDNEPAVFVNSNWTYNGGKLVGDYTYNYKGELIIAVGEYDAITNSGESLRIPLKSWNLDSNNLSNTYNIEDNIPKFDVHYYIENTGRLVCGVYTFFVRFKVDVATYTKWFQLTDDIIIIHSSKKEKPTHTYAYGNIAAHPDMTHFTELEVNKNDISNSAVLLNIGFGIEPVYTEFQLGYILKRNEEILGRIENTYPVRTDVISIVDNNYLEEIAADDFLENPHQFYNVKNIVNYSNRLYIANYSEYKKENLQSYADKIKSKLVITTANTEYANFDTVRLSVTFGCISDANNTYKFNTTLNKVGFYTRDDDTEWINNPKEFVKTLIHSITIDDHPITSSAKTLPTKEDDDAIFYIIQNYSFWIYNKKNDEEKNWYCLYDTEGTINNYTLRIDNNKLVVVDKSGEEWAINSGFPTECGIRTKKLIYYKDNTVNANYSWFGEDDVKNTPWYPKERQEFSLLIDTVTYSYTVKKTYNNNRTLVPGQIYSYYIHYIRPDMSCTDGFFVTCTDDTNVTRSDYGQYRGYDTIDGKRYHSVASLNPVKTDDGNLDESVVRLIHPAFENIIIPEGYIGVFFTYESIEKTAWAASNVDTVKEIKSPEDKPYAITSATSLEYSGEPISGTSFIKPIVDASCAEDVFIQDLKEKTEYNNKVRQPYIVAKGTVGHTFGNITKIITISTPKNIYKKDIKTLYRLTKNIYGKTNGRVQEEVIDYPTDIYMYVPGYYNNDKIIFYDKDLIMSPTSTVVTTTVATEYDPDLITTYSIGTDTTPAYSDTPLNGYAVKEDYNKGAVSLTDNSGTALGVYYNSIISPDRLSDFLELPAAYNAKPSKTYTNYKESTIDEFNNTVYRSDVISDESLVNGFRTFNIDNYKNIMENKGEIVNIVGIGLYLIIHTRYSIFVFDRTQKLTNRTTLDIPDTFDTTYQNLLPANEGFGGLNDKKECIISKNGYIWFDKTNKIIFKYESGKVEIISGEINNLLKNLNIYTVRFAEDIAYNRLIICIYLYETDDDGNNLSITISYNFNTKTYISLHDYSFTDNFRTYNLSYLFDENKDRKRLYLFDEKSYTYYNLKNNFAVIYPKYE